MEIKGSCLCGAVAFVITGAPKSMGTCHCARCRKLGSSTGVFVGRDQFRLTRGKEMLETIAPPAGSTYMRSFCKACGTSLGEPLSPDDAFPINAQCLDDDPGLRVSYHEFTSDAPAWAPAEQMATG